MTAKPLPAVRAVADTFRKAPAHVRWSASDIVARLDAAIAEDSAALPVTDRRKQPYGHYLACPECGGKDTVVASHDTRAKTVVRRHKCKTCQHVYRTAMTYYAKGNAAPIERREQATFDAADGCKETSNG